jgi:hypothetical protein
MVQWRRRTHLALESQQPISIASDVGAQDMARAKDLCGVLAYVVASGDPRWTRRY